MRLVACRHTTVTLLALLIACGTLADIAAQPQSAPGTDRAATQAGRNASPASPYEAALQNLTLREIGPAAMGGRVDDFAVVESNPAVVYVGTASGGLWKTTNAGTTWTPLFDAQPVSTIGDVTLAPSDPSVVWVGTGEPNNRQSSSWGNGVYKSTDGGATWRHMGLEDTDHIGRIVVHPTNPDVVYVAALGRLWGANKERGLFKTTDAGATWEQVLAIDEDTGVVELAMDPESPDTLYAAAYQRRRTVFGFAGSGPGGGIHKTVDGGKTWKRLENGLPWDPTPGGGRGAQERTDEGTNGRRDGAPNATSQQAAANAAPAAPTDAPETAAQPSRQEIGRIGLAIYRRDPRIVYAIIEHAKGGIFRSEDRGETWRRMSATNPRPMYYSHIYIDPGNDQRIWVLAAQMFYSEDGGRTFVDDRVEEIHGDFHALWINPAESNHVLAGSDGGIHWSWDAGRTWDFVNTIPLGQFYEIGVDMRQPYRICGGLQDNNSWCGPSASMHPDGIRNSDWFTIGGGDGFYARPDPSDPTIVYAESQDGNLLRRDLRTGESTSIRPQPAEGQPPYRFQWNSPIVISAHDPQTIYYGGNVVFKSTDRGDRWSVISPDLTTGADRNSLPIFGRAPDRQTRSRHDGVRHWPALTQIAESPLDPNVLWVGTDDGLVQITRDGGKRWNNVTAHIPGLRKGTYVSRLVASRHGKGTAYATFDGHRSNDFGIYAYRTSDFGETWEKITGGMRDDRGVLNVIREHPRSASLLFAGGEYGAYVSFSRGERWVLLDLNLPTVPVDDIAIHPRDNDLILGTHGRSIWVLDDIAPLSELNDSVLGQDLHLFTMRPAMQWRQWSNTGSTGHKVFLGENPPYGAIINYYLKEPLPKGQQVKIVIEGPDGKKVRELTDSGRAGINRVTWDTRYESPVPPPPPGERETGGSEARGRRAQARRGPTVDPGEYTVKVAAGSQEVTGRVKVVEDPRITFEPADRTARRAALETLMPMVTSATIAERTITRLRKSLTDEMNNWKKANAPKMRQAVTSAARALLKKIDAAYPSFATLPSEESGPGDAGPPLIERPPTIPERVMSLYGAVANTSRAPTTWQQQQITLLEGRVNDLAAQVRALAETDLPALNKLMNEAGVTHVTLPPVAGTPPIP